MHGWMAAVAVFSNQRFRDGLSFFGAHMLSLFVVSHVHTHSFTNALFFRFLALLCLGDDYVHFQ